MNWFGDCRFRMRMCLVIGALVLSTGCKEVLYSGLTETEANEMTTILEVSGVDVSRKRDKDGIYQVLVAEADVAGANSILISNGLPRRRFARMDEVFDAQGLVGTPFEERVRYIFALEEKLTEQLVSIHGVRDARVTVNLPEKARFQETDDYASASLILHYEPDFDVSSSIPKIKSLIANSVQGLEYETVAVVVFPAKSATVLLGARQTGFLVGPAEASGQNDQRVLTVSDPLNSMLAKVIFGLCVLISLLFGLRVLGNGRTTRGL